MSIFHSKTIEMLGAEVQDNPDLLTMTSLEKSAKKDNITVPKAFLEWSGLDRGIAHKYSNQDRFIFNEINIIDLGKGRRGILFEIENQGNYQKVCVLDEGDDPPVMFSFCGEPWVEFTPTFSECIFAQIFIWQYWLFMEDGEVVDMAYTGDIQVIASDYIEILKRHFTHHITTHLLMEGEKCREYLFSKNEEQRVVVYTSSKKEEKITAHLMVLGKTYELTGEFEAEVLSLFEGFTVPTSLFSSGSPQNILEFLDRYLTMGWLPQISAMCLVKPDQEAIDKLVICHNNKTLAKRFSEKKYPNFPKCIGGSEWGVTIRFKAARGDSWWFVEMIEEA